MIGRMLMTPGSSRMQLQLIKLVFGVGDCDHLLSYQLVRKYELHSNKPSINSTALLTFSVYVWVSSLIGLTVIIAYNMIKLIKINIVFHLGLVKEVLMCWLDLQTWTGPTNSAAAQVTYTNWFQTVHSSHITISHGTGDNFCCCCKVLNQCALGFMVCYFCDSMLDLFIAIHSCWHSSWFRQDEGFFSSSEFKFSRHMCRLINLCLSCVCQCAFQVACT